jgi:probable F420-dependent oxidoreductase
MRFFLYCTYVPADQMVSVAEAAERLGFDGVSFPDHVLYPIEYASPYPYSDDGRATWSREEEWPDPFVVAGAIAARTRTIQLLTGILVLPLRHPLLTAKAAATIEALAPGRFLLGVGSGWLREEFEILGQDFTTRGRRMDEAIEAMRAVWTGEAVEYHGAQIDFPLLTVRPAPTGPIPIYVGGGPRAVERAARYGDGFVPPLTSHEATRALLDQVHRRRVELGRERLPFEVVAWAGGCRTPEEIEEIGSLGVAAVRIHPFSLYGPGDATMPLAARIEALERYAAEVLVPLRG